MSLRTFLKENHINFLKYLMDVRGSRGLGIKDSSEMIEALIKLINERDIILIIKGNIR
jgi:hypothetical protein